MNHLLRIADCYVNMDHVVQVFISKDALPHETEPWIVLEFNNGNTTQFTGPARERLLSWLFLNAKEA